MSRFVLRPKIPHHLQCELERIANEIAVEGVSAFDTVAACVGNITDPVMTTMIAEFGWDAVVRAAIPFCTI